MGSRSGGDLIMARRAACFTFLVLGHMVFSLIAWVPEIIDRLDISFAAWGLVLGLAPLGSLSAIVSARALITRFGSVAVMRLSGPLSAAFLIPLGFINVVGGWAATHVTFSFLASLTLVSLNTHALLLQKKAGKPILTGMHAGWSIGAVAAAITGGATTLILALEVYLILTAVVSLVGFVVAARFLLAHSSRNQQEPKLEGSRLRITKIPARLWLMGIGLLCAAVPELAVFEWSAVFARETGADLSIRALPFAAFMTGMIMGRLSVSRLARRFDVHAIAVTGASISAVTMSAGVAGAVVLSTLSPSSAMIWMASCWLFAGLGLAPLGPAMLSAGSTIPGVSTTHAVSVMSFVMQITTILAKVLMGAVAEGFTVSYAFVVPVVFVTIGAVIAHQTSEKTRVQDFQRAHPITGPLPIIDARSRD